MKIRIKKNNILTTIFFILSSFVINYNFIFVKNNIGLRDDWSMPPFSSQIVELGKRFLNSWVNGSIAYRNLGEIPGIVFGVLSKIFNINGDIFSKVMIALCTSLSGITMYFLCKHLRFNSKAALVAGLFYLSAPIVFNAITSGYLIFLLSYSLLPLLILQFYILLTSKKNNIRNIIICSFIFRLIISQDNYLHIVSTVVFISLFVYFIEAIHTHKIKLFVCALLKIIFVYILTTLLSLQFVLLFVSQLKATVGTIYENAINWNTHISPDILHAFTLDGAGYSYYLDSIPISLQPVFMSLKYLLLAFSILGFRKNNNTSLYRTLGATFILSIFLFKGGSPPFESINSIIYQYLTFYTAAFRNVQYFTVLSSISISILLASFISNNKNTFVFLVISFLVVVGFFPYFLEGYTNYVQTYSIGGEYKVLLSDLSKNTSDMKILWLPSSQPMTYKDSKYPGNDPFYFGNPKYYIGNNPTNSLEKIIFNDIYDPKKYKQNDTILDYLNVEHIVMRKDFQSMLPNYIGTSMKGWTNENIQKNIDRMSNSVNLEKTYSENLSVYKNTDAKPLVYLSYYPFITSNTKDCINVLSKKENYDGCVGNDNFTPNTSNESKINKTQITYTKVNPTLYRITINNISGKVLLIQSENYNDGWKVFVKEKINNTKKQIFPSNWFCKNYLPDTNHFLVNGFANGWVIDVDSIKQPVDGQISTLDELYLEIEFLPQTYYFLGLIANGFVFGTTIIYLIIDAFKKNE